MCQNIRCDDFFCVYGVYGVRTVKQGLTLSRASSQFECYNEELIFFSVPYIPVYMGIYYLRACDKF